MYDNYTHWMIEEEMHEDPHAWRDYAECLDADEEEEKLIFPWTRPEPTVQETDVFIKERCGPCPVQTQCLRFAARTQSIGIWGGHRLSSRDAARLNRLYQKDPSFHLRDADEALHPEEYER